MEMTMIRTATFIGVAALIAGCALAGSCANAASSGAMSRVESACLALGLNPSEAPYAYCIQSLAESASAQLYAMNPPTEMSDAALDVRIDTGHGADTACAAIGLDPATARFSYCVSNLRATIDQSNNIGAR
jgi:hypothetical protein